MDENLIGYLLNALDPADHREVEVALARVNLRADTGRVVLKLDPSNRLIVVAQAVGPLARDPFRRPR